jgi:SPOR domain
MTARLRSRGMVLLYACLMLADCGAFPSGRDVTPRDALPVDAQDSLIGRQLMGQNPNVAPLQPEPGDIWADVLPTQPPAALTPRQSGQPAPPPLRPEPGDIWADVLSTQPPEALTPSQSGQPVAPPHVPTPAATPSQDAKVRPARPASADDTPAVQLATADTAQAAVAAWAELQRRLPDLLRGHPPQVWAAEVDGRAVWHLRAAGFATVSEARAFCARMHASKAECQVARTASAP